MLVVRDGSHLRCGYLGARRALHIGVAGRQVGDAAEQAKHAQSVTMFYRASELGMYWLPSALPALGAGLEHLKGEGTMFFALECVSKSAGKQTLTPPSTPSTSASPPQSGPPVAIAREELRDLRGADVGVTCRGSAFNSIEISASLRQSQPKA